MNEPSLDTCTVFDPIYPSVEDRLTPETARQIVAHNEKGETLFGWNPPNQ